MDVDTGAEGNVDCGVKICRQENDAFEVFKFSEEDYRVSE